MREPPGRNRVPKWNGEERRRRLRDVPAPVARLVGPGAAILAAAVLTVGSLASGSLASGSLAEPATLPGQETPPAIDGHGVMELVPAAEFGQAGVFRPTSDDGGTADDSGTADDKDQGWAQPDRTLEARAPEVFTPPWSWPLEPEPRISRRFIPPPERWLAGHRGVDLASGPSPDVLSPADGTVAFVGMVAGRPVISIIHGSGLVSSFEPVHSTLAKGAAVSRGQALGKITGPPHCPFTCLHWGVRLHGGYVDPLRFVTDRRPSVLLPLRAGYRERPRH